MGVVLDCSICGNLLCSNRKLIQRDQRINRSLSHSLLSAMVQARTRMLSEPRQRHLTNTNELREGILPELEPRMNHKGKDGVGGCMTGEGRMLCAQRELICTSPRV